MIIIETRKGPVFINDGQIREITFNKDENEVLIDYGDSTPVKPFGPNKPARNPIMDVENVMYVPDCVPEKYQYKGSLVEDLTKRLEQSQFVKSFLREWYNIYSTAIDNIKALIKADKSGLELKHNALISIRQADDDYNTSHEEFEKLKVKYFPEEPQKE